MKVLFTVQIPNDPNLPTVERFIDVMRPLIDGYHESLDINLKVRRVLNGDNLGLDKEENLVINNNMTVFKRDAEFNKIPNPDYDTKSEMPGEEFLKEPAFDYITDVIFYSSIPLSEVLSAYILEDANDGRFD